MDAWDQADMAQPRPLAYYGQLFTSAEAVTFQPTGETRPDGKPKMTLKPFDPQVHKAEDRRVQVTLELVPIAEMHLQYMITQKTLDSDPRWVRFTLPSLKALNLTGRTANQQWVRLERRQTGRTFTTRSGEKKNETAMFVMAVYADEDACIAAWAAEFGKGNGTVTVAPVAPAANTAANPERDTALRFLPALWKAAGGDINKFAEKLANTAPVNKYFTIDSPEVLALIA